MTGVNIEQKLQSLNELKQINNVRKFIINKPLILELQVWCQKLAYIVLHHWCKLTPEPKFGGNLYFSVSSGNKRCVFVVFLRIRTVLCEL